MAGFGSIAPQDVDQVNQVSNADPNNSGVLALLRKVLTTGMAPSPALSMLAPSQTMRHLAGEGIESAKYPGQVYQAGVAGQTPSPQEMVPWATGTALGMVGGGSPFAEAGAVGAAGGRLRGKAPRPPGSDRGAAGAGADSAPTAPAVSDVPPAQKLTGLPDEPYDLGAAGTYTPGPHQPAHDAAWDYARGVGLDYQPPKTYAKVDTARAKRIAQAFEDMPHDPTNPKVAASYDAMIRETLGQWDAIKKTGLKVEFIPPDMPDPYAQTPRMAQQDVVKNNHLWVFPTEQGFGTGPEAAAANAANPMLRPAGEVNGRPVVANDIFRIVHDYFGHVKEGNGFRAGGEENAWRSHTAMYSPEARPAMTAETRGQNSWVNYGPHGENNRTANGGATVYAPQKIGLLPDWVMEEGRLDAPPTTTQKVPKSGVQTGTNPVQMARQRELEDPMMREPPPPPEPEGTHPLLGPGAVRVDISVADPFTGQAIKGRAFERAAAEASAQMKLEPKGAGPMNLGGPSVIQTEQTPIPRYEPPRGIPARMRDALQNPDVIQGVHDSIRKGVDLGAHEWYHTGPIHKSFVDVLGPEEGPKAFKQFMDLNAASSPRSEVPVNIRNASYYYSIMRSRGVLPERLPYPYGHIAQKLHRQNFETLRQAQAGGVGADIPTGGWDVMRNPKPPSYSQNLQGNLMPGTMDTHAYRNVVMRTGDQRFLVPQISEVIPSGRPSKFQQTFGEIKTNAKGKTIVTYRPRELHKTGRMTMEEMKKTPPFWESQPKANEYKAVEDFYRHMGQQHGLPTADAQAAAWAGGGDLTGLGSPPDKTFQQMMNERVLYTAKVRGENPRDTLRWLIQGRKPLLTIGGGALLGAGALRQNQPQR